MLRRTLVALVAARARSLSGGGGTPRLAYDHLYHIGSPVDVFKHCVLSLLLRRCTEKASPLTFVETHAGRGVYARDSGEALRLREFEDGVDVLAARAAAATATVHRDVAAFLAAQTEGAYVGSAALAALALRPGDRALYFERDAACADALRTALGGLEDAPCQREVRDGDGYAGARRLRAETRGCVFVDPPYQEGSDTDLVAALAGHLAVHWRSARLAVWYPAGDDAASARRTARLRDAVLAATGSFGVLDATLTLPDAPSARLRSSGVLFVQPPFKLDDDLGDMLPNLAALLCADGGATTRVEWLRES